MRSNLLIIIIILFVSGCSVQTRAPELANWQLAYHHDKSGVAMAGTKQTLIDAIRAGSDVRVFLQGRRVEHLVDANFITIFEGEVFAQIDKIRAQKPSANPPGITFRENDYEVIYATNGKFELKWFVSL